MHRDKDKSPKHGNNDPVMPRWFIWPVIIIATVAIVIIILGLGGNL